jgi:hypothetical protein
MGVVHTQEITLSNYNRYLSGTINIDLKYAPKSDHPFQLNFYKNNIVPVFNDLPIGDVF